MNVLTLTSLFPGSANPRHGVFVRERMAAWRSLTGHAVRVVAPVPWYPRWLPRGRYGAHADAPITEEFGGFTVDHPRYVMIPKVGVPAQGLLYERGVRACVRRHVRDQHVDLIDAHYAYPDGFAAGLLKERFKKPLVLTVRGTDVNLMPKLRATRSQVRFALQAADAVVAVSKDLAAHAIQAGAPEERVRVLRNGVDADKFRPLPRKECRAALGLSKDRPVLLSVGFLVPRKGHGLALDALAAFAKETRPFLLIAGDGPEESALREQIKRLDLTDDVRLLGAIEHDALAAIYSAADLLLLASSREGWANVILEAMACGTPVVATDVEGAREAIATTDVGRVVDDRSAGSIQAALREALLFDFDRDLVRRYAEQMSWDETARGLEGVFQGVLS